jgi:hypothetical protein
MDLVQKFAHDSILEATNFKVRNVYSPVEEVVARANNFLARSFTPKTQGSGALRGVQIEIGTPSTAGRIA